MKPKGLTSLESMLITLFVLVTGACIALITLYFVDPANSSVDDSGCGTIQTLSGSSGSFSSVNYPNNYDSGKNCMWEISVATNKVIHLQFEEFHLENSPLCSEDHVIVQDDVGILGTFCGHATPAPLVSVGNRLLISFISNLKTTEKGFKAQYEAIDPSRISEIAGGGGHLQSATGDFGTPLTPLNTYKNDALYQWKVSVAAGERVMLSFTSFDLEPAGSAGCKDAVEVYDGDSKGSTKLGQFCGAQIPATQVSSGNTLVVRFMSDSHISGNGFQARYSTFTGVIPPTDSPPVPTTPSFIESGCDSNALQEGRKGFIHSKNYPDTYPVNVTCTWNITVADGSLVKLSFTDFSVDGEACEDDRLEVSDTADAIGKFCGFLIPPVIISSSNKLFLRFTTDHQRAEKGFAAKWEAVHPDDIEEIQSCGGNFFEENGVIKSPKWPNNYGPNSMCVWMIQVPRGKTMTVKFTHFDLEDTDLITRQCYDNIVGYEESNGPVVKYGPYCGTQLPDTITTQGNRLTLRFHSDIFTEAKGFRAYWSTNPQAVAPTEAPVPPNQWDNIPIEWPNKCGQPTIPPQVNTRIVNGEPAIPHSWPWQVSMQVWPSSRNETIFLHTCGGTLIHKNWVLTAAHCFINYADELYRWQMCLGKHNLTYSEPNQQCFKVLGIFRHELFVYPEIPALEFDIALVKLDGEVTANDFIDFACLPPRDQVLLPNYRCYASGWGDETGNSMAPKVAEALNQVALPVIPYETCKLPTYWWFQIKESMICAGYILPDELKSVCQGDSGGPLVCPSVANNAIWEVHGITSFGPIGCIMDKKPSVFTRASSHIDWIEHIIRKDLYDVYSSGCGSARYLDGRKGSFSSMRYPATYQNDATCSWHIEAPQDKVLHVHFDNFLLEESTACLNDHVTISDELGSLGAHCGANLPSDIVSFSNKLSVNFKTNNRVVDSGFSLTWEAVDPVTIPSIALCGGHFNASNGEFISPNWPNSNYPRSHACTWRITVEQGKPIHVVFTDFQLQAAIPLLGNCVDYVEVYDGDRPGAQRLGHFCGSTIPTTLNTTGNVAVIKFVSNFERELKGFRGYWTTNLTDIPYLSLRSSNPWDDVLIDWPTSCDSPASKAVAIESSGLFTSLWHLSIQSQSKPYLPFQHRCAGSLINKEWVLLPAHCIDLGQKLNSWRVCLGTSTSETCLGIDRLIRHEGFVYPNINDHSHDIALVHLTEKATEIPPVCLPGSDDVLPAGELCYWAGWASTKGGMNSAISSAQFQLPIPIMSQDICSQPKFWWSQVTSSMICAGFESQEKLKSTCKSGAGGALICKSVTDSNWEVHGIASFGPSNCLVDRKPPVFTRVSAYKDWIVDEIKKFTYENNRT
ncbi:ovochymase-2-like [Discoglossus pictus]